MNFPFLRKPPAKTGPVAESGPGAPRIQVPDGCTLFHITHWKAASQWMRGILQDLFGNACVQPENYELQLLSRPIAKNAVYPCAYLGKPDFDTLPFPGEHRQFVLFRDLRDTLVSGYFSLRYSHGTNAPQLESYRCLLNRVPPEDGMLFLAETWLCRSAWIQRTWLESGAPWFKVEDAVEDAPRKLGGIFRQCWGLDLAPGILNEVTSRYDFQKLSGGRAAGEENLHSHYRKGVAGDWRLHFGPRVGRGVARLYNDILLGTGYATREDWFAECQPAPAQ